MTEPAFVSPTVPLSRPAAAPVLAARGVRKSFREGRETIEVLRGIDLELAAGEIVALEGPSGSGKTTLLSILGCILTPSAGSVVVAGEEVDPRRARRLPHNDVYTRAEWAARSRRYWVKSTGLGLNMYLTVFLGCLVGVVVVAQTLYSSTMEHLREFGTVKAIGGSNADIYTILIKQASIAAVAGFILGAAMAYAMRPVIASINLKLIITPELAAAVFFGSIVMCLASALVSFRKVASIDPALVFRG